jgi:adenylate cyclase
MSNFKASVGIGILSSFIAAVAFFSGTIAVLDSFWALAIGFKSPVAAPPMSLFFAILLAFGVAWTSVDISRNFLKIVPAVGICVLVFTWSLVSALYGKFLSPLAPVLAALCSLGLGLLWGRTQAGARKQTLERLFGQRLAREGFRSLVASSVPVHFSGEVINGTVLVVSVHNHSELMELLTPENYTAITNLYLKTASDYLVESGGYLDECNGECIRVVFGAPIPDERHAIRACRAAVDLASRLDELNKECDARWQRRLDVRMGLDSGDMIAAAFGGGRLGSFSVAGPAVDFARRLCASSPVYGTRILIGPDTYEPAAESLEVRPVEILKVSASRRRIEIYEILAPKHGLSPERERSRDHFWTGVLHYRDRHWEKAVEEFTKARISGIPDPALDFYLRRIEQLRRQTEDSHKDNFPPLFQSV